MSERGRATPDREISPMEARNEGQGRKGASSDGPLPAKKTKAKDGTSEDGILSPIREGGQGESRDDR